MKTKVNWKRRGATSYESKEHGDNLIIVRSRKQWTIKNGWEYTYMVVVNGTTEHNKIPSLKEAKRLADQYA